jgi:DnaK suppressor protein
MPKSRIQKKPGRKAASARSPRHEPGFTRHELDEIRRALIEQKKEFQRRVEKFRDQANEDSPGARGELSSVPLHPADLASETFEQDKELGMTERDSAIAAEIDEALNRIEEGTFGLCERCEKQISKERLQTLPRAAFCIDCQCEEERLSGGRTPRAQP